MKTTLCLTLTLLTFVMLIFVPNSFAQDSRPIVRLIYFVPSDRQPQPDMDTKFDRLIKEIQQGYEDLMEAHGFGKKTFLFETDANGNAVVHTVNGRYPEKHYNETVNHTNEMHKEIAAQFDRSKDFYLIAIDISSELIGGRLAGIGGDNGSSAGWVLMPASGPYFNIILAAHELGHAFGLIHDYRCDVQWVVSPIVSFLHPFYASFCAAEWLDVHRAFSAEQLTISNSKPTFDMLPPNFISSPAAIRLRFNVTDPDGIHQVQLLTPENAIDRTGGFLGCKNLNGSSNATVEFVLSNSMPQNKSVRLRMIDGHGNISDSPRYSIVKPASFPDVSVVKPDLVLLSPPQVSKATLAPGESFTFSVTVKNDGDGPSGSATLWYYYHASDGIWIEIGTDTVSPLATKGTSDADIQLTAPDAPGTYTYYACVGNVPCESNTNNNCTTAVSITVVKAPPESLMISSGNNQNGTPNVELTDPLVVQVQDDKGKGVANVKVTFRVTAGRGKLTSRGSGSAVVIETNSRGFAEAAFTPTRAGIHTIQASVGARVDPLNPVTFTVTAGEPPAKLVKVSGDNQSGSWGTRLAKPFVVEVQDKDGKPVEGIPVTFQVAAGSGNVSAKTRTTGANGRAQTDLTLGSKSGVNTVQVRVEGVDPGTFRATAEPKVLIAQAQRPPMYWVNTDAGTLHRLVGMKVENLLPSVQNATSLTVDTTNGKLYWTEKTGNHRGRIRHATLDGSNPQLVKDLTSVPISLTLDVASGKLYLINGWNKIQRMNVNGSGFQPNLIIGLQMPKGFAVDGAGGKVYWIEQTGERTGNIRSANLDGSNGALVKALTSVPGGIAVDTVGEKLYITNAYGKVQRLNFNGKNYQSNLITGLKSPMDLTIDSAAGKVYWTEGDSLRRADLNGENVVDVVTGLGMVSSLVLGTPPVNNGGPAAPTASASVSGETVLLANYPNPFNPETWIPYQLSKPAEVTLHIYAVNGTLVRTLALGHQPAGMYHSKSRAAYWDGQNEQGEKIASGVYFYTLTAGDFTATRKMLIRK